MTPDSFSMIAVLRPNKVPSVSNLPITQPPEVPFVVELSRSSRYIFLDVSNVEFSPFIFTIMNAEQF